MRSGTARLSHGPASMPRHHANASARVCGSIVGSVIESFTAGGKVWSPPDGRKTAVVLERCETARTDGALVHEVGGGVRLLGRIAPPRCHRTRSRRGAPGVRLGVGRRVV